MRLSLTSPGSDFLTVAVDARSIGVCTQIVTASDDDSVIAKIRTGDRFVEIIVGGIIDFKSGFCVKSSQWFPPEIKNNHPHSSGRSGIYQCQTRIVCQFCSHHSGNHAHSSGSVSGVSHTHHRRMPIVTHPNTASVRFIVGRPKSLA